MGPTVDPSRMRCPFPDRRPVLAVAACTLLFSLVPGADLSAVAAAEPTVQRAGRIAVAVARSHVARRFKAWLGGTP